MLAANTAVDQALDKTKKGVDNNNWPDDELKQALDESLHTGTEPKTAVEIAKGKDNNRLRVYLGKYYDEGDTENTSYTEFGEKEGGTYFSMDDDVWRTYKKQGYNMWVLNLFFLNLVISLNCIFMLCHTPSQYYNIATQTLIPNSGAYGDELNYINHCGYNWNKDIPIVEADHA